MTELLAIWTEGVCGDGAVILRNGVEVKISDVLLALNEAERMRVLLWMIQDQSYHPSGYLKDRIEAAVKYG